MPITQNTLNLPGSNNKPISLDIMYDSTHGKQPVILYAHGFNGFKDWGNFNLVARQFVAAGFTFIKFNFSHNGTSSEHPEEFIDLKAFAENNYTLELDDLEQVICWINQEENPFSAYIDAEKTGLIGHSMGGGISIIKASENNRIKALITWASISICQTPWSNWTEQQLQEWQTSGVQYYHNGRTHQQMPMHYQLYQNFQNNKEHLDIVHAAQTLKIPFLICHGTADTSVTPASAYTLHQAAPDSELFLIDSDHVFGRKHPWEHDYLPLPMQEVVDKSISFLVRCNM